MIKIKLVAPINGKKATIVNDSDLPPAHMPNVTNVEFKLRGEGVGKGLNGLAPNRAIINFAGNYRAIPLPDGFDADNVNEIQLMDNNDEIPAISFLRDEKNLRVWNAQQPIRSPRQVYKDEMKGDSGGSELQFWVEKKFLSQFPQITKVGVNILGNPAYLASCEVILHKDEMTDDFLKALDTFAYDIAEEVTSKYGKPFGVNVDFKSLEGETLVPQKRPMGDLSMSAHPEHAGAGRLPVHDDSVGPGSTPQEHAAVKSFPTSMTEEGQTSEILKPGQNSEPYGGKGPND
jgi:hypothetical protein